MSSATEVFDPYREWLGIKASELPADHYRLLGLTRFETDVTKIQAAADGRMALIRSYQTGPRGSYTQNLLNEISTAKLCLLSPPAKLQYDQFLEARGNDKSAPATFFPTAIPLTALPSGFYAGSSSGIPALEPPLAAPPVLPMAVPLAPPKPRAKSDVAIDLDKPSGEAEPSAPRSWRGTVFLMGVAVLVIAGLIWGVGQFLVTPVDSGADASKTAENPADTPGETDPSEKNPGEGKATLPKPTPLDPAAKATVVLQEASRELNLPPSAASLVGAVKLKIAISENVLTGWTGEEDAAIWKFKLQRPGFFKLELTYANGLEAANARVTLSLDAEELDKFALKPTGGMDKFEAASSTVVIKSSGTHTLKLQPSAPISEEGLILKSLRLIPVGGNP